MSEINKITDEIIEDVSGGTARVKSGRITAW